MRHLGNGVYETADGHRHEYDGTDLPPPCVACEGEERADEDDGLCSFCRDEGRVGAGREPKPQRSEADEAARRERLAQIGRERRASIEAEIDGWANQRAGHRMLDRVAALAGKRVA